MMRFALIFIIGFFLGCVNSKEQELVEGHIVYTARSFDSFDSTITDTFYVGEDIVFGARSDAESKKGDKLDCSRIIIGIYQMPNEKIIFTTERDVAPDWTGTRQDVRDELPYLEPGNYIVRFIKLPSNEIYAKGKFVVINK